MEWKKEGVVPSKKGMNQCNGPGAGEPQTCAGVAPPPVNQGIWKSASHFMAASWLCKPHPSSPMKENHA